MNKIVVALILLSVAGCARQPTIYYGRDGGRIGYNGIDFDQAYAECQYSVTNTINTGPGDPFYRAMSGGQMLMDSCMRSKGFAPKEG
jgi:hypothetical protein